LNGLPSPSAGGFGIGSYVPVHISPILTIPYAKAYLAPQSACCSSQSCIHKNQYTAHGIGE
jgi:hypothetical protein